MDQVRVLELTTGIVSDVLCVPPRIHSVNSYLPGLAPPKRAPPMLSVEGHANEAPYWRPSHPARKRNVSFIYSIRGKALT